MKEGSTVYLIPSVIEENAIETIPPYIIDAIKKCQVIFAENERTVRRFLKRVDNTIVIDNFEWFSIHKTESEQLNIFEHKIKERKNIAIISEAGCPGIADPGQLLVEKAHQLKVTIKPLVGPSSILLALMASGLNGQTFTFNGYLPIENIERVSKLKLLESESLKKNCTQLFIETPYRNNALLDSILKSCKDSTLLSIAAELCSQSEYIRTQSIDQWKADKPNLHKKQVMFLLMATNL